MGLAADAQNMTGTAPDPGTLEMLTENAAFFDQAGIIPDAFRTMLWTVIKVLRSALNSFDGMLQSIYDLLGFASSEQVQDFMSRNHILPMLLVFLSLGLIYLGYSLITGKVDQKTNVFRNFLLMVVILTCMPIFISSMTDITMGAVSAVRGTYDQESGVIGDEVLAESVTDLKYMANSGFDFTSPRQNGIRPENVYRIDINEVVNPEDEDIRDQKEVFSQYVTEGYDGEETLKAIDYGGWLDIFPKLYYRFHLDWATVFITYLSLFVVIAFTCYKIARIILEIAVHHFLACLFGVTDLTSGQRTREVLKSLVSLYAVVFLTTVILKFYFLGIEYFKAQLSAGAIGKPAYILFLIAAMLFVVDGPNIIERTLGVDAGIKSGYQLLMGGAQVGRIAMAAAAVPLAAGRTVRNAAIGDPYRNTGYDAEGNRKRNLGGIAGFTAGRFSGPSDGPSGGTEGPGGSNAFTSADDTSDRTAGPGGSTDTGNGFEKEKMDQIRNNRDPVNGTFAGGVSSPSSDRRRSIRPETYGRSRYSLSDASRATARGSGTVSRGPSVRNTRYSSSGGTRQGFRSTDGKKPGSPGRPQNKNRKDD